MSEALLEWMETWTTLHWQVQVLYVVDGYECTLERDGNVYEELTFKSELYALALHKARDYVGGRSAAQWEKNN